MRGIAALAVKHDLFVISDEVYRSQLLKDYPGFLLITLAYVVSLLFSFFSFRHMEASASAPLCNTSAAMVILMLLGFYAVSGRGRDIGELLTFIAAV